MDIFRRLIELRCRQKASQEWEARAALEDDFHHFHVTVHCAGDRIQSVTGKAVRNPYSLCPQAANQLTQLTGMTVSGVAHSVTRIVDPTQQCTHMLELAGLAIALIARRSKQCSYSIEVPKRVQGSTVATLKKDSKPMLIWHVTDNYIAAPVPYVNVSLRNGMARWALNTLDAESSEAALVLRRAVLISRGREIDQDTRVHAAATRACFVQQPDRAPLAQRMIGSTWDFSSTADSLCSLDKQWLAWQ